MKVLHIITRMNTGGPAVFLDHLTNAMNDLGTQSTIAYGYCESNETDYTQTHNLNSKLLKIKTLHRSLNPFDDIRAFFALRRVIKEINPDLVNTHTSKAGVLGRIAAKSTSRKIPVVHTYHGHLIYGYFAKYKIFLFTLIERFLANFTDAAACITQETQDSLRDLKIGRKLDWRVIRLGIPINQNLSLPDKQGVKTNLLWVGRFTDIKDPFYAISVIDYLEKISPGKFDLTMVGGGELLEESIQLSKALPITFSGWLENPFKTSGHFDLLLLTSKNEGMGLVMLEAANLSRACVARNVGGIGEFLKDKFNGVMVSGTSKEMAHAISNLSQSDITKYGLKARETLVKDFSSQNLANNYLQLYKALLI
jgi:glycosyltransferase involved in cell wall biosynthesis